jgi:hypothetical protein
MYLVNSNDFDSHSADKRVLICIYVPNLCAAILSTRDFQHECAHFLNGKGQRLWVGLIWKLNTNVYFVWTVVFTTAREMNLLVGSNLEFPAFSQLTVYFKRALILHFYFFFWTHLRWTQVFFINPVIFFRPTHACARNRCIDCSVFSVLLILVNISLEVSLFL